MGRLFSSGFELQSVTAGMEWSGAGTAPAIETTTVRSGAAALRVNASGEALLHQYTAGTTVVYIRAYVRFVTLPNVDLTFFRVREGANSKIGIKCTSAGVLKLWNEEDNTQIGSDSSAISTGTWYRIELKVDPTTLSATACEALIDGSSFASGTANLTAAPNTLYMGVAVSGGLTVDVIYDDVAINDDSGTSQNSWPGEGEIIHLRPDSAGVGTQYGRGGADSGANWSQVDEITPNDATDFTTDNVLNETDLHNIAATPAGLASDDVINVTQVGWRFNASGATSTDPDQTLLVGTGGTYEGATATDCNTTSWNTHAINAPKNYILTNYDLPGASTTAWSKTTLDAAEIGYQISAGDADNGQVTAVWLLVDHKPAPAGGGDTPVVDKAFLTTNTFFWG